MLRPENLRTGLGVTHGLPNTGMPPQPQLARGPHAATYPAEHLNGIGSLASLPLWITSGPGGPAPPMMAVHERGVA